MVVAPTEEETAASGLVRTEDFYNGTAATEDADSGSPLEKMDFTTGLADAKNITFDIDYGARSQSLWTVVGGADPFLHEPASGLVHLTNTGDNTSPVRVSYKVPANYNLGKELGPEPEFVLSVPDANTFHFKKLSITAAMGDAEFDNSNTIAADSIDLDLAMGNFTGSTVQAEQFTANISMGDFDLGLLAGVETAKVEAAMGDIRLTVDGRPDDYALDLQTSMGECGVQRQDDEQHLHPNSRRAPQRDPYRVDGRCSADDDAVIPMAGADARIGPPGRHKVILLVNFLVQNPQLSFWRCRKDFRKKTFCILSAVVVQSV